MALWFWRVGFAIGTAGNIHCPGGQIALSLAPSLSPCTLDGCNLWLDQRCYRKADSQLMINKYHERFLQVGKSTYHSPFSRIPLVTRSFKARFSQTGFPPLSTLALDWTLDIPQAVSNTTEGMTLQGDRQVGY